jgi:hypothetical protein
VNVLDFVALILAAGAVVDVWFNGSIFAEMRAWAEAKANGDAALYDEEQDPLSIDTDLPVPDDPPSWWMRIANKIVPTWMAELLTCPFCLSYHAPVWLTVVFILPGLFLIEPGSTLLKLPLYCLAATRGSPGQSPI